MLRNKYGKVFVIALMNIVAVFFFYINVATQPGKFVLEQNSEVKRNFQYLKDDFKHETDANQSENKSDKHNRTQGPDKQSDSDLMSSKSSNSSNSFSFKSMKNLLSMKIRSKHSNKIRDVTTETIQDEEL